MHNTLKLFFSRQVYNNRSSQIKKRIDDRTTDIIVIDNRAYWVSDSVFYTSNIVDGKPNISDAAPVDIYNMPKKELDKMLFILDNLSGGKNERGGTGN